MKNSLVLLVACFSLSSFAESNLFHCEGDGVSLSFQTSSFIGHPSLHLERNDKTLHFQSETTIQMQRHSDGLFVAASNRYDHVSFTIPKDDKSFSMKVRMHSTPSLLIREAEVACEGQLVNF